MSIGRSKWVTGLKVRVKRMGAVKAVLRFMLESYRTGYMRLVRLTQGIDRDKIVFSCFNARTYGDNLKPISEYLHEIRPQTKIVWMFRDPAAKRSVVPDYVKCADPISLDGLKDYATAKVWVDNFTLPRFLKRRIGSQFYLNTWHGDRAFKKIAYDMFPERRLRIEETCDTMLAGSDFGVKLIKSAFRYKGSILNAGSPRNDCLVNYDPEKAKRIREKMGVPEGVKILLYAPTFRDSTRKDALKSGIDFERTLADFEKLTGGEWICFFRAHQLALGGVDLKNSAKMRDMTGYEDMADLLLTADALITDYSSSAMDFALTGRRVFLYQEDIEAYTTNDRELYFKMEDSPFFIAHDQAELSRLIADTDDDTAKENCQRITDFFGFNETGEASRRAAERIADWMDNR